MNAGAMADEKEGGKGHSLTERRLLELEAAAVRDLCYAASLLAFVALIMRVCVCDVVIIVCFSYSVCVCVCASIMETRHAGNANKKEVAHKKLAHGQRRIGQRDSQAKAAGYAYQI